MGADSTVNFKMLFGFLSVFRNPKAVNAANGTNRLHGECFKHCTERPLNITRRGYLTVHGEGCSPWAEWFVALQTMVCRVSQTFVSSGQRQ